MEEPSATYPQAIHPQSSKKGCFFYGCLVSILIIIVAAFALYFGGKALIKGLVQEYSAEKPLDLSGTQASIEDFTRAKQKVDRFIKDWDQGIAQDPLILTNQDINAFLSHSPDFKDIRGKLSVQMEGNKIKSWVSIPLKDLNVSSERYINGFGEFRVFLQGQVLFVFLENLSVNEKPLPEDFMVEIRKENLAKDISSDPEFKKNLDKFEKIEVRDGTVILIPRKN